MANRRKRPRDANQLAKSIVDIATRRGGVAATMAVNFYDRQGSGTRRGGQARSRYAPTRYGGWDARQVSGRLSDDAQSTVIAEKHSIAPLTTLCSRVATPRKRTVTNSVSCNVALAPTSETRGQCCHNQ
jgi:hypothetical protein